LISRKPARLGKVLAITLLVSKCNSEAVLHTDNTILVTLLLSEKEFGDILSNKVNAQKLFMAGKLKIKGYVLKVTKLERILKSDQIESRL